MRLFQGWDLDIDSPDYNLIQTRGAQLNALIQRKARQHGWRFIDVAPDFVGHGYCDENSLFIGASESCRTQGDFEGTMHPNLRGHTLAAAKFVAQLRKNTVKPLRGPMPPPVRDTGGQTRR